MSDTALRQELIKLAFKDAGVRGDILPLVVEGEPKLANGFEQAAKKLEALAKKLPNASVDYSPNWKLVTVSGRGPSAYFSINYRDPKSPMGYKLLEVEMKPYEGEEFIIEIFDTAKGRRRSVSQFVADKNRILSMAAGDLQRAWKNAMRQAPRMAAEIKTPKKERFYGIMGREKGKGRFKPFDYQAGRFVTNVIHQTMWGDKKHVQSLVDAMNRDNPAHEFKVVKRASETHRASDKQAAAGAADLYRMLSSHLLNDRKFLKQVEMWLGSHLKREGIDFPQGRVADEARDLIYNINFAPQVKRSYDSMMKFMRKEYGKKKATLGPVALARIGRLTSMHTADIDLSFEEQLRLMKSNPPRMQKDRYTGPATLGLESGADLWSIEIFSPVVKRYMSVAEWKDENAAKYDLKVWEKAHKETLKKLQDRVKKLQQGKTAAHVPSALRNIQRSGVKRVIDGKNIRLYRGDNSVYIIEVPQKPLKRRKVRVMSLYMTQPRGLPGFDAFLPVNLLKDAKVGKSDTYDQALKKIEKALASAEKEVTQTWEKHPPTKAKKPDPWFPSIQQNEVNYLLIEPADTKPQTVKGKDFTVKSTWVNFEAYSPGSDLQQMDPHYTKYEAKSPGAARKFYKILKAKPDALKSVSWNDFGNWLNKNKIGYDTQFSVWH